MEAPMQSIQAKSAEVPPAPVLKGDTWSNKRVNYTATQSLSYTLESCTYLISRWILHQKIELNKKWKTKGAEENKVAR